MTAPTEWNDDLEAEYLEAVTQLTPPESKTKLPRANKGTDPALLQRFRELQTLRIRARLASAVDISDRALFEEIVEALAPYLDKEVIEGIREDLADQVDDPDWFGMFVGDLVGELINHYGSEDYETHFEAVLPILAEFGLVEED